METQSPTDNSVLVRAIDELRDQITCMRAELSEVRRISSLTEKTLKSYYADTQTPDRQRSAVAFHESGESLQGRENDRRNPPLVPEGTRVTCLRCGKEWTPRARRPRLCPRCKTPWWFPPRWKWRRKLNGSQETLGD